MSSAAGEKPFLKTVLIIDDEHDFLELLTVRLQNHGLKVIGAQNGNEGFEKVQTVLPDCILLDIRMPEGGDGLTFLRKLRSFRHEDPNLESRLRRCPVMVLTASHKSMRTLFEQEGIQAYLTKPFDFSVLVEQLHKIGPVAQPG